MEHTQQNRHLKINFQPKKIIIIKISTLITAAKIMCLEIQKETKRTNSTQSSTFLQTHTKLKKNQTNKINLPEDWNQQKYPKAKT